MITQILFEYRIGMLDGTTEFKESLQEHYNVLERPIWMPAAGGNYEMWIDIFINSGVLEFLKDAFIGGAAYELAKHTVFKPFINSLNQLESSNQYGLEIQKYRFFFEDTKVVIYGLTTNFTSIFSAIFNELFNSYELIGKAYPNYETDNISEIRIPVEKESGRNEWWVGPKEIGPYLTYWGISVDHGLDHFIWDVQTKTAVTE